MQSPSSTAGDTQSGEPSANGCDTKGGQAFPGGGDFILNFPHPVPPPRAGPGGERGGRERRRAPKGQDDYPTTGVHNQHRLVESHFPQRPGISLAAQRFR